MTDFYQIHDLRYRVLIGEIQMTKREAADELHEFGYGDVLTEDDVRVIRLNLAEGHARDVTEDFLDAYRRDNAAAYIAAAEASAADLARAAE